MGAPGPFPSLRGDPHLHTTRLVVDVLPGVDPGLGRPVHFECFDLKRVVVQVWLFGGHDNGIGIKSTPMLMSFRSATIHYYNTQSVINFIQTSIK